MKLENTTEYQWGNSCGYLFRMPEKSRLPKDEVEQMTFLFGFKDGRIQYLSDTLRDVEELLSEGKIQEAKNILARNTAKKMEVLP